MPPPKENFNLYVNYQSSRGKNEWYDVFYELNSAHQRNRLSGNEAVLLSFSNALRYYSGSAPAKSGFVLEDDVNFLVLKKMISQYLLLKEKVPLQNLEIIIGIRPIYSHSHYHYYKY